MCDMLLKELGLPHFHPRPPWWGADLQTLRDTLRGCRQDHEPGQTLQLAVGEGAELLALLDPPLKGKPLALVLLCHGLGGSSESEGMRRLAMALRLEGLAVLRLNLRGAGRGRSLAPGSYAADCNRDLLPVLRQARGLAAQLGGEGRPLPLAGAGLSLGGTILLNALAASARSSAPGLEALACISSPLDLDACSRQFERPRNRLYHHWLVRRLRQQVLADPSGLSAGEHAALLGPERPRTIRAFDSLITAPRWGYDTVDRYYEAASPLHWLDGRVALPPTLLVHADDDPWVPPTTTMGLARELGQWRPETAQRPSPERSASPQRSATAPGGSIPAGSPPLKGLEICITRGGGHNGFHGQGDSPLGSWSDRLTARWLKARIRSGRE